MFMEAYNQAHGIWDHVRSVDLREGPKWHKELMKKHISKGPFRHSRGAGL